MIRGITTRRARSCVALARAVPLAPPGTGHVVKPPGSSCPDPADARLRGRGRGPFPLRGPCRPVKLRPRTRGCHGRPPLPSSSPPLPPPRLQPSWQPRRPHSQRPRGTRREVRRRAAESTGHGAGAALVRRAHAPPGPPAAALRTCAHQADSDAASDRFRP